MNTWNFFRLIRTLYRDTPPNITLIQSFGLLAVKIGQVYALRPDFLGEERCQELAKLYRHTQSIPREDALELLRTQGNESLQKHLTYFNPEPVASASIGQVHAGTLDTGESVAIKLVKKRFTKGFAKDVQRMKRLFRFAIAVYPKLAGVANPVDLLGQIERMTVSELDLRNEVAGHKELRDIHERFRATFDLSRLRFPTLHESLSGKDVLVSEFVSAKTIDEHMERGEFTYDQLLDFFHIHGFYLFYVGVFHGDIHPGNILYDERGFCFIDTGYIGRVSDRLRIHLFRFFDALSMYDYETCAQELNEMADDRIEGAAYVAYRQGFFDLYANFRGRSVSEVSFTQQMMRTIRLGVLHGMRFSEGIFDIIKSMMYLDGMVLRTNPNAVLLEDMRPFLARYRDVVDHS